MGAIEENGFDSEQLFRDLREALAPMSDEAAARHVIVFSTGRFTIESRSDCSAKALLSGRTDIVKRLSDPPPPGRIWVIGPHKTHTCWFVLDRIKRG